MMQKMELGTQIENEMLSASEDQEILYDHKLKILALILSGRNDDPIYANAKQESDETISCWLMRSKLIYQFIKGQSDEQLDNLIEKVRLRSSC